MNSPSVTKLARTAGEAAASTEDAAIGVATHRIYRFRARHPLAYGLIAFVLGGALVGLFTMSTYGNWAYEGIDLKTAFYQVVFGSLGGGVVLVVLAFGYASAIRPTLDPLAVIGIPHPDDQAPPRSG